jgi:DNA helicase-2/ATP-dependent DNA helicase PcrA
VVNPADALAVRRILNTPKRGLGPAAEAQIQSFADLNGITVREALRSADSLSFGPKAARAISDLSALLDEATALADGGAVAEVLQILMQKTGYLDQLRTSKDPQDEARAENVDELMAVTKEFAKNNPEGTLIDFLTEVALVAAADELDDESGSVSLMTLHTAKGLEYDAVFITGVEEELLPHRMAAMEPGGPAEERRLFYVGITRARQRLFISLAMTRAQFGQSAPAAPSRYLQEIPAELIEWREQPGMLGGWRDAPSRSLGRSGGWGDEGGWSSVTPVKPKTEWANRVTNQIRDNGDLTLQVGDRITHVDFGEGTVMDVTGVDTKRVAHVRFDQAGPKKLLIKIAPIEKI